MIAIIAPWVELIGLIASMMTMVSSLPQILKIIKTKSVNDISLETVIVLTSGLGLWTIYGFLIFSIPIIISSGVQFILELIIFILCIRHRRNIW